MVHIGRLYRASRTHSRDTIVRELESLRILDYAGVLKLAVWILRPDLRDLLARQEYKYLFGFLIKNDIQGKRFSSLVYEDPVIADALGKLWETEKGWSESDNGYRGKLGLLLADGKLEPSRKLDYTSNLQTLDKAAQVEILPPRIIHADNPWNLLGRCKYSVRLMGAGLVELEDVRAIAGSNAFYTDAGTYVDEYRNCFPNDCDPRNDSLIMGVKREEVLVDNERLRTSRKRIWDEAFWLSGGLIAEWGHFVTAFLVKLDYYRSHHNWGKVPVLVPSSAPEHMKEFLTQIVPNSMIRFVSEHELHIIKHCIYSPSSAYSPTNIRGYHHRHQSSAFVDPRSFARLHSLIREHYPVEASGNIPRYIYWTREDYSRRRLNNRQDLVDLFEGKGLTRFNPAAMPIVEQIAQIVQSEFMIGEMGSWIYLTGLNANSRIVVIMSDWDQHFWNQIGLLNELRRTPIEVVLGQRSDLSDFRSENAPHREYSLSKDGIDAVERLLPTGR